MSETNFDVHGVTMTEADMAVVRESFNLKPCPFCGANADIDCDSAGNDEYMIGCGGGTCPVYVVVGPYPKLSEAAEAWNHRAGEQ
jgi:hypothetical protein